MITNYTQLKTEVADFAHRTDLTSKMDTFCQLAEALINKDLRCQEMTETLNFSLTNYFYALPDNYVEMRWVTFDTTTHLESLTRDTLDFRYSTGGGKPQAYALSERFILIRPGGSVADPYTIDIEYYKRVETLTSNSTNEILKFYPMIYLAAMMIQVSMYLQDSEELNKWDAAYTSQVTQANKAAKPGRTFQPQVRIV